MSTACAISTSEEPYSIDTEENTGSEPDDDPWDKIPNSPANLITNYKPHISYYYNLNGALKYASYDWVD